MEEMICLLVANCALAQFAFSVLGRAAFETQAKEARLYRAMTKSGSRAAALQKGAAQRVYRISDHEKR